MELKEYIRIVRDQWRVVLATVLIVVSGTAVATILQTPRFTAQTELFFSLSGGESVTDMAQGGFFATAQMESYARVAKSPLVLTPVADGLRYPGGVVELGRNTKATTPPQTVLMTISVTDTDPLLAARAANAIGAQTIKAIGDLNSEQKSTVRVNAKTVAEAQVPSTPSEPNALRNIAAALAAGLLLGWGLAFLRNLLDSRVRTPEDAARVTTTLPSLGTVPTVNTGGVVMIDSPRSVTAENYRRLATNLRFITADSDRGSVLVTSSVQGEGKSTTAVNMAVALAEAGLTVLLIDADLRAPQLANMLGLENVVGLTTVLSGQASVTEVLQPSEVARMDVLASGQLPPNPSGLLGSRRMQELLDWAESRYDIIVVDSPPLLPVTDAAVLAPQVGNRVLVMGAGKVTRPQVHEALESLARVDSPASGYVLNRTQQQADGRAYEYGNRAPQSASEPASAEA